MTTPSNFSDFFLERVSELITRSNDKYSCIEDQWYYVDKFPKYTQDGETVFDCKACGCLLQVDCLTECDYCQNNFCDFKHTSKSICTQKHDCACQKLKRVSQGFEHRLICETCITACPNRYQSYRQYIN